MKNPRPDYHVYLLRLWRDDETTPWRIQAEAPHTGEVLAFADLESLFVFLKQLTGRDPSHSSASSRDPMPPLDL